MKTLSHSRTHALAFFISLFSTLLAGQGTHLLNTVSFNPGFISSEQAAWDTLNLDNTALSITLLELDIIAVNSKADSLYFAFPGRNDTLLAVGQYYEKRNDSTYVWWGNVGQYGDVVALASTPGGRSLYAKIDSSVFFAHPLSNRYNALVEHRLDSIRWNETCVSPMEEGPDPEGCLEIDTCKNVFHVLVLVTDEAMEEIVTMPIPPSLEVHIPYLYLQFGMHTLNLVMLNSGLAGKTFRFSMVHYDFNNYSDPIDYNEDIVQLISDTTEILDLSISYHADAVVMLYPAESGLRKAIPRSLEI